MPELKNYRLLISHSWKYSTQYDTILEWLNTASNFKWSNHSVSADNPFNTKTKGVWKNESFFMRPFAYGYNNSYIT